MTNIEKFLKDNPDLSSTSDSIETVATNKEVKLTVIVLKIGKTESLISHLNHVFLVNNSDFESIELAETGVPNPFGKGKVCDVSIKMGSIVTIRKEITIDELVSNMPYPISRPSNIPLGASAGSTFSEKEQQWFNNRNIDIGELAAASTYTNTSSNASSTTTYTNTGTDRMVDDTNSDDSSGDDSIRDDANVDDVSPA